MPRCPLCRSAVVTIGFGLYPIATCSSCGARWIQDGRQQRAINQSKNPRSWPKAALSQAPKPPPARTPPPRPGQLLHGGLPW
jgi:Zn-finger nucleic acid-binding protein